MSFNKIDNALYYCIAQEAVQLECEGDYRRAVKAWKKATGLSRHRANQQWSESRADFCQKQVGRKKIKEATSGLPA